MGLRGPKPRPQAAQKNYRPSIHGGFEPTPREDIERPAKLTKRQAEIWESIVPILADAGMAVSSDAGQIHALCQAKEMAEESWKAARADPTDYKANQIAIMWSKRESDIAQGLGMTPTARAGLRRQEAPPETATALKMVR